MIPVYDDPFPVHALFYEDHGGPVFRRGVHGGLQAGIIAGSILGYDQFHSKASLFHPVATPSNPSVRGSQERRDCTVR